METRSLPVDRSAESVKLLWSQAISPCAKILPQSLGSLGGQAKASPPAFLPLFTPMDPANVRFTEGERRAVANLEDLRRRDWEAWIHEVHTRHKARRQALGEPW